MLLFMCILSCAGLRCRRKGRWCVRHRDQGWHWHPRCPCSPWRHTRSPQQGSVRTVVKVTLNASVRGPPFISVSLKSCVQYVYPLVFPTRNDNGSSVMFLMFIWNMSPFLLCYLFLSQAISACSALYWLAVFSSARRMCLFDYLLSMLKHCSSVSVLGASTSVLCAALDKWHEVSLSRLCLPFHLYPSLILSLLSISLLLFPQSYLLVSASVCVLSLKSLSYLFVCSSKSEAKGTNVC